MAAIALKVQDSVMNAVAAPMLLMAMLVLEQLFPTGGTFQSTQSIHIQASPSRVWEALTRMPPIEEPPALPFALGVAYPVSGEMAGRHEGALRYGHFSTGTAVERVTVWRVAEELSFEVIEEPLAYWLPLAQWVVERNNHRMLSHIKRQAEAGFTGASE